MSNGYTVQALSLCIQTRTVAAVEGAPGTGKTASIEQIAEQLNVPLWTVLGSISDPTDFGGIPVVADSSTVDGREVQRVRKAPPMWAWEAHEASTQAKEGQLAGIVFADELTTSPPAVQAAMLRILLSDHYGRHWVGDLPIPSQNIAFITAFNPPEIAAGGWALAAPLANRLVHLAWPSEASHWAEGIVQGWPEVSMSTLPPNWRAEIPEQAGIVASYIQTNRDQLQAMPKEEDKLSKAWPSCRTWDMAIRMLAACEASGARKEVQHLLVEGCIGNGAAVAFLRWRRDLDLPNPKDVLKNPETAKLPHRSDQVLAVASSVVGYVLEHNTKGNWEASWVYLQRLADEHSKDTVIPAARRLARGDKPEGVSIPKVAVELGNLLREIDQLKGGA